MSIIDRVYEQVDALYKLPITERSLVYMPLVYRSGTWSLNDLPERFVNATFLARPIPDLYRDKQHCGYDFVLDRIIMPDPAPAYIASATMYMHGFLHELTHWSGHSTRLARTFGLTYGSYQYSLEEVIAETGSVLLSEALDLPLDTHAAALYISIYSEKLSLADKKKALDKARTAHDYIMERLSAKRYELLSVDYRRYQPVEFIRGFDNVRSI